MWLLHVMQYDGTWGEPELFATEDEAEARLLLEAKEESCCPEYDYLMTGMDRSTIIECMSTQYELTPVLYAERTENAVAFFVPGESPGLVEELLLTPDQARQLAAHLIEVAAQPPPARKARAA